MATKSFEDTNKLKKKAIENFKSNYNLQEECESLELLLEAQLKKDFPKLEKALSKSPRLLRFINPTNIL